MIIDSKKLIKHKNDKSVDIIMIPIYSYSSVVH